MASNWIKPSLKAMLICDRTIIEEGTRKRSLIGIFDGIRCSGFPIVHPFLSVYIQFNDLEGEHRFTLEMVDLSNEKALTRAVVERYLCRDKMRDNELAFNLGALEFPAPGEFEFRIYADDVIFGQKKFIVHKS